MVIKEENTNAEGIVNVDGVTIDKANKYFYANGREIVISDYYNGVYGCTISWIENGELKSENLEDEYIILGGSQDGDVDSSKITVSESSTSPTVSSNNSGSVGVSLSSAVSKSKSLRKQKTQTKRTKDKDRMAEHVFDNLLLKIFLQELFV